MRKIVPIFFLFLFCLYSTWLTAQHNNNITAILDGENHQIEITQHFTYQNDSDSTLHVLYFNDWNHAYSSNTTPLSEKFGKDFDRSLHLAKKKDRGFTAIKSVVTKEYEGLDWERTEADDIIKIKLAQSLAPKASVELFFTYTVRLPDDRFTDYGHSKRGEYFLKDWYLTPTVFENGWQLYSNKGLDDLYNAPTDTKINLVFPSELFVASNFDTSNISKFPNGQQVVLTGKNRKSCDVVLTQEKEYTKLVTPNITFTTNIESSKYPEVLQVVSIDKVAGFLHEHLGKYPYKNLLVSTIQYNKNPLYGINQLPSFIRPYSEEFQFEMKFLKTAVNQYLNETLYINQRKERWVSDAIVNYLIIKYVELNYPDQKLTGQLSRIWGFRSYNLAQMHFNDQYYYLQMVAVRRNDHQALATPSDSLNRFNQRIANRYKAGQGLAYLAEYIGYENLDAAIKEFYGKYRSETNVKAAQLKKILMKKTKLDINWFFDEYVALRNNIDFKITRVSKDNDSISFTIKNKTGSKVPISLFGLKKDSIISKYWFTNIDSTNTFTIPNKDETRLVLNYDQKIPEANQRNNWKSINGFPLSNKKLRFRFGQDTENPFYNQIFYIPEFKFTVNDGISAGISLKNKPLLIRKPFIYSIKPRYSTREEALVGSAGFSYQNFFNEGKLNSITYSFGGGTSFFDDNSRFTTITPAVNFTWRPKDFLSNRRQFLFFRLRNVFRNIDEQVSQQIDTEPDFTVFNVRYGDVDNNNIKFRSWVIDGQLAGDFSKLSFEWEQRTLFENNRQLNLRFYAGKFITNRTDSDFFSFALDRPTDYLFDLSYLNRSQNATGLTSQQFILAEGGFKSIFDDRFGNDWILTGNLSFNVWQWVELYGDIGAIRNRGEDARFVYDYGVRLNFVTDFFELYFPIYSNNGYEIAQPNYEERIRFVVTVSPKTLVRLFTRRWF